MKPAFILLLLAPALTAADLVLQHDLDGDGANERISITETLIRVESSTMSGTFPRPEGIPFASQPENVDHRIRFADLNTDKHAELLFSDGKNEAVWLWNKVIRLDLGWAPGWSQKARLGAVSETGLPDLAGTTVRMDAGKLHIVSPNGETIRDARALIAIPTPPPRSPEEGLKSLRLPEGFRAALVASEPQISDPVAFDWAPDGRLWVVQMNDYPTGMDGKGAPGGVVKMLTDENGDGFYEKAVVFADALPFPTGVKPWRNGVLIAAAPDVIFAEDTDGDGRADRREVLFTGFEPGNQQHRFNGFEWGLDGWLYLANGDSGGTVKSTKTGRSVKISGRDVRIRPDSGEVETVSGMTQYGLRRDDWGNWFGNNNPVWLWHVTLPEIYLRRNPQLAVKQVKRMLANYAQNTRVYPTSSPVERPNQPWSMNHVTSGSSPTPYRHSLFGESFANSVFIAEPVHNCVHQEVLVREGSGFRSVRAVNEKAREFLTSDDHWFRPVFLRTGPDGALWVADFYRFVLEHPEWISPAMQARLDIRAGSDRGRIYRIFPTAHTVTPLPDLSKLDTAGLVHAMQHTSGWQRDMAQQLLLERGDKTAAVPALQGLLAPNTAPQGRIQALATLGCLNAADPALVATLLNDPNPWVRCEALRQAERLATPELFPLVANASRDTDAAVRLQSAFSLAYWPPALAAPVLTELAATATEDDVLRAAIQSSLHPESPLFQQLKSRQKLSAPAALPNPKPSSPDRAKVIAEYAQVEKLSGDAGKGHTLYTTSCAVCHTLRGEGHAVGPDLGMMGNKPVEWLLAGILDPSQVIEARYQGWTVKQKDGTTLAGILAAETNNNIVLNLPGGQEAPILRQDITGMAPLAVSLMPVGFESSISPQQMADLLAFIRGIPTKK